MVEFLAFSDTHFHEFKTYAQMVEYPYGYTSTSINNRLRDALISCYDVLIYAQEHDIKTILFGGDLFHVKHSYSKATVDAVYHLLASSKSFDVDIYMIPGNHDFSDRDCVVAGLLPFAGIENVHYLEGSGFCQIGAPPSNDKVFLFYNAYVPNKASLLSSLAAQGSMVTAEKVPTVMLAHAGVQGARVGSNYVLVGESDISTDDIPSNMDICLFGHFHEHQKLSPNAYYIGSTHQHNWGDAGGKRGFVHVKIDTSSGRPFKVDVKHIENTSSPRFINLYEGDVFKSLRSIDFVRYYTKQEITQTYIDNILGIVEAQAGVIPKIFEIVPLAEDVCSSKKLSIDDSKLSTDTLADEWVQKEAPKDSEKVLELGKEILAEARNRLL